MAQVLFSVICPDVPASITIGKKKHYLTGNLYYGGVHWAVRKKIVEDCKLYLLGAVNTQVGQIADLPIAIEIEYHSSKHTFDLDNKSSFWLKVLLDLLKSQHIVPDDNVKFISSISSRYHRLQKGQNDLLTITIKKDPHG